MEPRDSESPVTERRWWWCLRHSRTEYGAGCPDRVRLGPFATEDEAALALQTVAARNEAWDEADAEDAEDTGEDPPSWSGS